MFLKRIFVLLLCGLIACGAVVYTTTFRFFDRPLTEAKQEKFRQQISLPDNFTLAASVNSFDTVKNTLQAARKNVNEGSYALELNVACDKNGTLFLADGPEYITSASVKLETIFKEFQDSSYLRYILRIMNHAKDAMPLIDLATRYNLFGRIMLIGFTLEDMEQYAEQYCNFMICAQFDTGSISMLNREACYKLMQTYINKGAGAISCKTSAVTDAFLKALNNTSRLRLVLEDVNSNFEMYHALSMNPNIVITEHPEILYNMMLSQDYLDLNKDNTF